jgi:Orsellinic acid/F9775 biosynthesis cluster protein D
MDQFIHLPEFRIIICKECKYAVLPSYIDTHFATKPHKSSKKERQEISEEVGKIEGLIGNEETLRRSEFPFPPATSQPIAALGKPNKNGLQCTTC